MIKCYKKSNRYNEREEDIYSSLEKNIEIMIYGNIEKYGEKDIYSNIYIDRYK